MAGPRTVGFLVTACCLDRATVKWWLSRCTDGTRRQPSCESSRDSCISCLHKAANLNEDSEVLERGRTELAAQKTHAAASHSNILLRTRSAKVMPCKVLTSIDTCVFSL
eukprot:242889-Amphidinium_carterae.1